MGLMESATARLKDAQSDAISKESRFDLAYNAAHALALAALRSHGYRPDKRYIVFRALEHSAGMPPGQWRILDKAHSTRNSVEYEGYSEVDEQLLAEVLKVALLLETKVAELVNAAT